MSNREELVMHQDEFENSKTEREKTGRTQKTAATRIIYDIGSNNGDDIPYYLKKGDLVVAIEANPQLCELIKSRFKDHLNTGQLVIENCVLIDHEVSDEGQEVPFYISKISHVQSQYPKPEQHKIDEYDEVSLPAKSVISIFETYGKPYYVKIDIEHFDECILKSIFDHNIFPPYISAESHSVEVFAIMVALGNYNSFKVVDGKTVAYLYKDHLISTVNGDERYSFPFHSAGPFGEDIKGDWLSASDLFYYLALEGLGWKDIHATNTNQNTVGKNTSVTLQQFIALSKIFFKPHIPKNILKKRNSLIRFFK